MWKTVKLDDIAKPMGGSGFPKKYQGKKEGEIPFFKVSDMNLPENDKHMNTANNFVSRETLKEMKAKTFPAGTIIFPKIGGAISTNKKRILTRTSAFDNNVMGLIPSEKILSEYLYMVFLGLDLYEISNKAALPSITATAVKEITISLPPLAEQQRIVAKLDAAFAEIDEASEKIIKARDPIAQLYINFLRNEMLDSSYDWHTVELGNIAENLDSARVPITKSNRTQGSIPYYGASGIVDYVDGYLFNEDLLLISEDGANLLMRTYPIAFSVSGKTWVNNHAHVLKFADKEIEYWVEQYLNITNLSEFITGMAQPKLNQKKLNSIPIPIPSKKKRLRVLIETIKVLKMRADCLNDAFIKKEAQLLKLKSAILFHELQSKEAA